MKIVELAFIMLVFNFCMGIAVHSGIATQTGFYESQFGNTFNPETGSLPANISTTSETQQYGATMDVLSLILSVTDFGWVYSMVPPDLKADFIPFIMGLQCIVGFFYAIAIIEMFVKYTDLLGSARN